MLLDERARQRERNIREREEMKRNAKEMDETDYKQIEEDQIRREIEQINSWAEIRMDAFKYYEQKRQEKEEK
jgi:hypothetical protein